MGWLFAVALGMHRHSGRGVLLSLLPIAAGHAMAVGVVLFAALGLGFFVETHTLMRLSGILILGWAVWHALYGHRQRVRVGMQTGLAGLLLWSFLMASAHGAGLMLIPVLAPICLAGTPGQEITAGGSILMGLAALAVHTAVMLATIGAIALAVYHWVGVDFLRRGWINLDLVWVGALALCGAVLLVV